jgi:4-azaleucine resistance transporter AzlC
VKKIIQKAIILTIPVMLGYVTVGMAFGMLFESTGLSAGTGIFMSLLIYAGSMQFIALDLFLESIGFLQIALLTFFINMRHMFYGFSFIDTFKQMKTKKWYMIFALTDETYSLLVALETENTKENHALFLTIALLNQLYWLIGTGIGIFAGRIITIDTTGIEFAMTALFVVIFVSQLKSAKSYKPAIIGVVASMVSVVTVGASGMILPTMSIILLLLNKKRKSIDKNKGSET